MNRNGFSLVEVMIAITILSVVLIALGGLMFQVAERTRWSAAATYRAAAAQKGTALIRALAWDSIDGASGCTSDSSGLMEYDQCISVVTPTARIKLVTLVIHPTGVLTARPETLTVYRSKLRASSPF